MGRQIYWKRYEDLAHIGRSTSSIVETAQKEGYSSEEAKRIAYAVAYYRWRHETDRDYRDLKSRAQRLVDTNEHDRQEGDVMSASKFEVGSRVEAELWNDKVGTTVYKVPGTILAVDSEPIGVSVSVYFDRDVRDIDINAHQLGGNAIPDGHGLYFWFSEPVCGRYSAARLTLLNDDSAPVEDEEKSGNKPSQPLERYQVKLVPTYVGRPDVVDPRRLEKTLNSMSEQGYRLVTGTPTVANAALVFERREEER